ncbi:MFS transporter [Methanobacterium paludis]|uniref:Major facilitator superfamily MFS_1 n=1 Tax=Methanobacterium paludis (strain DSM 25820 / JCM 18151 / SWAN1) TaxID=868131 RepID=F6D317_METPW|nr:MFS transporter [Methanobacterium paludis]AEG17380.1 major facilitator superfamily MFS_1 [Methanobacterium paludis]
MAEDQYKWGVVIIACLAVFIIVLDSSAMNVAITALVKDLNTTLSMIQAIIALYALIIASFMLLGSKLQDILGRKKTFLTGLFIYATGTTIATLSVNAGMLLLGWAVLEGIGAALMLPATTTIVGASYKGKDKITAFGIWGGIAAMGAAIGPIVGGVFTTYLTWRLVFGSELIFVAVILIFRGYLTESQPTLKWKDLDVVGTILSIVSLVLLVMGILLLSKPQNWAYVSVLVVSGSILFVVFILWQRRRINRGLEPLSDISLLKNRIFGLGNINSIIQQIPLAGFLFIIPVFLQQVTHLDAFMTGLALLPASLTILVFSLLGAKLASRLEPKYILMAGFLVSALGTWMLGGTFNINTQIGDIIPGTIVFGVGVGLLLSQLTNLTMSAARGDQESDAAGFLNAFKNLGYSMGTALIGVLLLLGVFWGLTASIESSGLAGNMSTTEIQDSLFNYVETMQTTPPQDIPSSLVPQVTQMVDSTISSAMKMTFNALALIFLLGFFTSLFLPRRKIKGSFKNS